MGTTFDVETGTFAPLRVPAFRRASLGWLIAHTGMFLQMVAGPWLMNEMTGSPFMVALVTSALWLPRLLFTVPAGVLADVFDRRNVLVFTQLFSAVIVGLLAWFSWQDMITPGNLLVFSLLLGVGNAASHPAYQTFLPDLVPASLLPNAVTLGAGLYNAARAIGPSIGGALVAAGLTPMAFAINAATYVVVVVAMLTVERDAIEDAARQPMFRSVAAGVQFVRFTQPIRVAMGVTAGFAITAASVQSVLPSVVSDDLDRGAGVFGLLYAAIGVGAIVGAATRVASRRVIPDHLMLPMSIGVFGLSGIVFGLSRSVALSGLALFVAGICWLWTMTTLNSCIQLLSPRWVRGRVVGLFIIAAGLQPFGSFVAGALAEVWGPGVGVAIMTAGTAALGLWALRMKLPVLDDIVIPAPPDDWAMAPHPRGIDGTPVTVMTTWRIDAGEVGQFLEAMRDVRRHRMRTGARRWALSREVGSPTHFTESFEVFDWDEHLAQHQRLDADVAAALRRALSFDQDGGPATQHFVGVDLAGELRPIAADMLAEHASLHERDGSLPFPEESRDGEARAIHHEQPQDESR